MKGCKGILLNGPMLVGYFDYVTAEDCNGHRKLKNCKLFSGGYPHNYTVAMAELDEHSNITKIFYTLDNEWVPSALNKLTREGPFIYSDFLQIYKIWQK